MGGVLLRKYGVGATINFALFEADGVNFRTDAVYAAGDVKIMRDEGAEANTANGFVDEGTGYSLVLTATEMQASRIVIYIVDQDATKLWLDRAIVIETYGHASAQHPFDLSAAEPSVNVVKWIGTAVTLGASNKPEVEIKSIAGSITAATQVRDNIPLLDSAVSTCATPAQVNTEVDNALNTAIPASPTVNSINERLKTIDDAYTAARAALLDNLDLAVSAIPSAWDQQRTSHNAPGTFGEDANQKRATLVPKKIIADPMTGIVTYRNETDTADAFRTKAQETATAVELVDN